MQRTKDKRSQAANAVLLSNRTFDADTSKQFIKKRKRRKGFDFEIDIDGEKLTVHKEVLKRCRYFASMFRHEFNETNTNSIAFSKDVCFQVPQIVDYLYSGTIKITKENVFDVFSTARYLRLEPLETSCIDYIKTCVNHNTVDKIRDISQRNYMAGLVDYTLQFLEMHFEDFIKHKAMKRWPFELLNDLLKSNKVQVNSEAKVVQLVTNWLNFDFPTRKTHMDELLAQIRYSFLTPDKIAGAVGDDACLKIFSRCSNYMSKCLRTERVLELRLYYPRLYHKGIYLFGKPMDDHPNDPFPFGRYWPNDNTFTKLKSPSAYRSNSAVAVVDDKVYLVGGRVNDECVNTVEVYNPVTNNWSSTRPLNKERSHHCCCGFQGKLFVFGGQDSSGDTVRSEVYCPRRDRWVVIPHEEKAKYGAKAIVLGDSIFLVRPACIKEGQQDYYIVRQFRPHCMQWINHLPSSSRMEKNMFEILVAGFGTKLFIFKRQKQLVIYDTKKRTYCEGHLYNPDNTIDVHNGRKVLVFHDKIYLSQNQSVVSRGKFSRAFAVFDPKMLEDLENEPMIHQRHQIRDSYHCEKNVKLDMGHLEFCLSCI